MKTKRILIVEDNRDDEVLLMRQLKKAEMDKHVLVIRDGGLALDVLTDPHFKAENFAAIFLDLDLPKVSGLQLLETIRANEQTQDLSVVIMTSSNSPESLERCKELGVSCYVAKPLTFPSFAKAFADTFHDKKTQTSRLSAACAIE